MSDNDDWAEPVECLGTPLERLMESGQALIDEARAAIAEERAQREAIEPLVALDERGSSGPAYITVGDYEAALAAAVAHRVSFFKAGAGERAECRTCGVFAPGASTEYVGKLAAMHVAERVLQAARVEVQRG
jgi:hypothetical protein